jgi:hypothetical protein
MFGQILGSVERPGRQLEEVNRGVRRADRRARNGERKIQGPVYPHPFRAARTSTRRLAYPFHQSTLQKQDEDTDGAISHLSLALQVFQQEKIPNMQDDIGDSKALLQLLIASHIESATREWLKAPDAAIEHRKACRKRHPGTGNWLVQGHPFSAWLDIPKSFL